ncbi:hypothetical protein MOF34_01430 [Bacillus sp. T17B1]|uniref:B3/B4 domain-containing protein n=1 Tax=Bacillus sp. T17B1 TaxID=2918911 RepID=UPI00227E2A28|nr:hypothetical protein [Bacillus sp. T17B1]
MKFIVDSNVFTAIPNACFGIVVAKGIDNTKSNPIIADMLVRNIKSVIERYANKSVKEDSAILPYREAFKKVNINPNKYMSSIEAMITRISKGKGLPSINPIVDLGNSLSLKYVLPMGAHDIDQIETDIKIRFSTAYDIFTPFGQAESEEMPENELVYAVGNEIRTRRWIWRQSEIGKITSQSKNIFFPIDGFNHTNLEAVLSARADLSNICQDVLGCREVQIGLVDANSSEFQL